MVVLKALPVTASAPVSGPIAVSVTNLVGKTLCLTCPGIPGTNLMSLKPAMNPARSDRPAQIYT